MHALSWTPDLATGFAAIDADHQEIIGLANSLARDPAGHEAMGGTLAILKYMEAHVAKHFFAEEELMARYGYPHMFEHMAEHGRIVEYVTNLCREVRNDNADVHTLSVSNRLLCNWMVSHITNHDLKLAEFLRPVAREDAAVSVAAHGSRQRSSKRGR